MAVGSINQSHKGLGFVCGAALDRNQRIVRKLTVLVDGRELCVMAFTTTTPTMSLAAKQKYYYRFWRLDSNMVKCSWLRTPVIGDGCSVSPSATAKRHFVEREKPSLFNTAWSMDQVQALTTLRI